MEALNKEFLILGRKIKVQATTDKNSDVIRIGITNVPYEKDDKLKPLMIRLFEKYGSILEIGFHHTVDGGWCNGRGYVTLVKDRTKNYEPLTPQISSWEQDHYLHIVWSNVKPICNHCHVDDHTRVNYPVLLRRRKACFICESTQHLKAQCPDAPWNCKRKQVATHRSRVMNANVDQMNTEKETVILSSFQKMDTEMPEDNSKPDSTSVAEDKDDFQEAISTLDSKPSASLKAQLTLIHSVNFPFMAGIARTTLEQPKDKGGVSLLNVEVQQKVFQFRYINLLLFNCRQRIPDFLYGTLIFTLQFSFDAPSRVNPLIFKHSRSYGNMKGLHPLIPMFSALDSCPRLPTENDLTIPPQTSLILLFKDICEEDPQEKFKFRKFLQAQKAYHFFEQDFLSNGIQFKSRQHCGSPNILQKIKNAILTGNLTFKPYFASLLSAEQHGLELDNEEHPTESNINFDSFIQQMNYEDINITTLKNRQLKTMFSFNSNSQITNISHNNWKAFIRSPMHHIPRNVWYRPLHEKLSTRANLHRIIPAKVDGDYCQLCKLPETEQHMLFTCIQKQDLWNAAFKKYLSNPKDPNCSSIFEDLSTLRLAKYYILHYHDKFTIYDFFATVIRFIWKAYWQQFFEQTSVVDEIVLNQIQKELLKLSAYSSLC
ncbi:hypothetical protein G6F44_012496 [Rhizopus delemar]|nr:hypothetical protein G6F44_012496 [Rhizopus delemar]